MANILIGGDICPIGRSLPYFAGGDARALFGGLLDEFVAADLLVANLECPLIEKETPIVKCGSALGVDSNCAKGLASMHVNVVNLANNHILDHGAQGLRNTMRVCREAGMQVVGAGENLAHAGEVLLQQVKGVTVGIMAFAEHEFSIATRGRPGANPIDLMQFVRQMRRCRETLDYVIVLLHAGKEYYPYPSPELQRVCRFMVEQGAGAVICQHSHCPGCYEYYEGGYITYGQGNLIFDTHSDPGNAWSQGYLVRLSITARGRCETDIIPYTQSDSRVGARRMTPSDANVFRTRLQEMSARIADVSFVEAQWHDFCKPRRHVYFSILRGHNRLFRALNRLTHFTDWFYSQKELTALQNVIRCEAHREVLQTVLSEV